MVEPVQKKPNLAVTPLSANFTLEELVTSSTASRKGIDNTPPAESVEALRALVVNVLEPIRVALNTPISVESGYRCPALNKAVSGSKASQHQALKGKEAAADIKAVPKLTALQLATAIAAIPDLPFDQCILEYFSPSQPQSGWVHVSYAVGRTPRRMVLTIDRNGTRQGLDPKG